MYIVEAFPEVRMGFLYETYDCSVPSIASVPVAFRGSPKLKLMQEPLSPMLCLGVNPFPSRFIYRTALREGFARTQFKDPIKTELDRVYCFESHSPII